MSTVVLLLVSGGLIAAGMLLVWREVHGRRQRRVLDHAMRGSDDDHRGTAQEHAAVEPVVSGTAAMPMPTRSTLANRLQAVITGSAPDVAQERTPAALAIVRQWAGLQPVVDSAVAQVNAVLASGKLAIGAPGEPSWSPERGYGVERPILAGGQAVAWIRLECARPDDLRASVSVQGQTETGEIQIDSGSPVSEASRARVSELLSKCMKPAATYAVRLRARREPQSVQPTILGALKVCAGALSLAGARVVALGPLAWNAQIGRHRMLVGIQVAGDDIARIHIDVRDEDIEIAVGVPDPRLTDLARRECVPLQGLTIEHLAKAIASCVWPAIARYRESHRRPEYQPPPRPVTAHAARLPWHRAGQGRRS